MPTLKSQIITPRVRVIRTVLQVITSILLSVPAALALLPANPESEHILWAIGISNASVLIITAAQNAWEANRGTSLKPGEGGDGGQSIGLVLLIILLLVIILLATGRL